MACKLCKEHERFFSSHDVGKIIQRFFGKSHGPDDVMVYSTRVEINYKKIEYKHSENLSINVNFLCANRNLIHTITIENHTEMKYLKKGLYDFYYNSMMNAVRIINQLNLEIHFEGEEHVRTGDEQGIFDVNPDDVLIYNTDNKLLAMNMKVY